MQAGSESHWGIPWLREYLEKERGPNRCTQKLRKENLAWEDTWVLISGTYWVWRTSSICKGETHFRGSTLCCAVYLSKGYLWTAGSDLVLLRRHREESSHWGAHLPAAQSPEPRLFCAVPHSIAKSNVRSNRAPVTKVFPVLQSFRQLIEAGEGISQGEKTCYK